MPQLRFPEINQVTVSGRLCQDPESRMTENGKLRVSFNIACNLSYKARDGNWNQDTAFIPVSVWDKLAEVVAEHLHKGSGVFLTGRLKSRTYETSSGSNRTVLEVIARNIQFLDKKEAGEKEKSLEPEQETAPSSTEDDLPF